MREADLVAAYALGVCADWTTAEKLPTQFSCVPTQRHGPSRCGSPTCSLRPPQSKVAIPRPPASHHTAGEMP